MKSQIIKQYDAPHQFEPLLPQDHRMEPLLEAASDLIREAASLGASAAPAAAMQLCDLLRSMNSYYTNRIEGEHTRPADIERALRKDFSDESNVARRQRLAVSHIQTEIACERVIQERLHAGENALQWLYSTPALEWMHRQLFGALTPEDLTLADGSQLDPGHIRARSVAVGVHEAPAFAAVPAFLARWGDVYGRSRRGEASVVALAAAHHRLAWVHPFLDGNGRVTRLHTHLALHAQGLTNGLWSPLRGFARTEEKYRSMLKAADAHRRGDLDGRGNLTEAGLVDWIHYTIDTCIDQVRFMGKLLDVGSMRARIQAALIFEESRKSGVRKEAVLPLHYLFSTHSEIGRAAFKQMTGLGERVATDLISSLLKNGYLATDSPYGALRFAIPRAALRFYFPDLWPEAEVG
ncbi:MAG: Fic family protein [Rhodoferax sp.]|nr:Fic family protein [Rhodoferax sp.]